MERPSASTQFWLMALAVAFIMAVLAGQAEAAEYEPPEIPEVTEPVLPEGLPECALDPEAYEGEDQSVGELRALRSEAVASCNALVGRLDLVLERQWWSVAEAVVGNGTLEDVGGEVLVQRGLLEEIVSKLCGLPCPVELDGQSGPVEVNDEIGNGYLAQLVSASALPHDVNVLNESLPVADTAVLASSNDAVKAVDESTNTLEQVLFILCGVVIGMFVLWLIRDVFKLAG